MLVRTTPTVTISASPSIIRSGESTTLTWNSTNANACVASGGWLGNRALSNLRTFSPTETTIYTLTCIGDGASASASATVTVESQDEPQGGFLQFRSDFEGSTRFTNRSFTGQSGTDVLSNWDNLSDLLPWVQSHKDFTEGGTGDIMIVADPSGSTNRVVRSRTTTVSPDADKSRAQYSLNQVPAGKWDQLFGDNVFDKQFMRWKVFISENIKTSVPFNMEAPWFSLFEIHPWQFDLGRFTIHPHKPANSNTWTFQPRIQREQEGKPDLPNDSLRLLTSNVEVPFGKWFTLEVFFKYHETDGEWMVAAVIDGERKILDRFRGKTRFGEKMRNITPFKHYHHGYYTNQLAGTGGVMTYYDDLEIWSDYPANYWGDQPSDLWPEISIGASPSTISQGESSTLTWSSANVISCGKNGTEPLSGTRVVSPTENATYRLMCTHNGGLITATVFVQVSIE